MTIQEFDYLEIEGLGVFQPADSGGGGGGGDITVDDELSTTSTNPVQNKVVTAELNQKGTYSKPSGGIPKTDLASDVQTSLGKADSAYQKPSTGIPTSDLNLADLKIWLDDAGAIIYTLSLSGTTVTLDKTFLAVYSSLIDSARQNLFILPIGGTTQNPVVLILSLQKADAQTYSITLGGEYNGNRYSVTLSVASVNASSMTGTLTVEPLAELPTVSASDNGKFLRVVSGAWAAQAVPLAESNSFGGGA